MKKITLIAVLLVLIITSCKKEVVNERKNLNNNNQLRSSGNLDFLPYGNITVQNGILYFTDVEDLRQTLHALANNQEYNIEQYQGDVSGVTDIDAFNDQVMADGWDANQTFIDFENEFGFTSLRPTYEEKITTWGLNGLKPNDPNNPDLCLPTNNLPLLTVLNPQAVFGCEGKLYKIMNNGVVYVITDGDIPTIDLITPQYQMEEFIANNVEIINPELLGTFKSETTCYTKAKNFMNYNWRPGEEHVQDKMELFRIGNLYSFCEAKMINWRHKGSGRYTRQSRKMSAGIKNDAEQAECGLGYIWSQKSSWKIVDTRTKYTHTINAPSYQASEGKLFTDSELEYYGDYYHWHTLLK